MEVQLYDHLFGGLQRGLILLSLLSWLFSEVCYLSYVRLVHLTMSSLSQISLSGLFISLEQISFQPIGKVGQFNSNYIMIWYIFPSFSFYLLCLYRWKMFAHMEQIWKSNFEVRVLQWINQFICVCMIRMRKYFVLSYRVMIIYIY